MGEPMLDLASADVDEPVRKDRAMEPLSEGWTTGLGTGRYREALFA
jgi:hypothetical protein